MANDSDASSPSDRVTEIHEHLEACLERPVERSASRWIAEAEAVARDVADGDPSPSVLHDRLGHVRDLLAEIEDTEDERADEHVELAKALTEAVLNDLA